MADYEFDGESRFGRLFGPGNKAIAVIVAVVLVAMIVGFVGYTIHKLKAPKPSERTVAGGVRFHCMECKEEFGVPVKEILKLSRSEAGGGFVIDCQLCKAKGAALRMRRCPNPKCKKYFVSQISQAVYKAKKAGTEVDIKGIKEICLHCGTDVYEYLDRRATQGKK